MNTQSEQRRVDLEHARQIIESQDAKIAALIAALRSIEIYSEPGDDVKGNETEMLHNCYAAARATLARVRQ